MPRKRLTSAELKAQATDTSERMLGRGDGVGREHLAQLLDDWVDVAQAAVAEIEGAGAVTILNAGEQTQKHPAVTVLEAASKRVEALVVLLDRFGEAGVDDGGGEDAPPRTYEPPRVVES